MADQPDQSEKTEDPTAKKLEDAHKRGEVAKSQEVNTWFVLLMVTLLIAFLAPSSAAKLGGLLRGYLSNAHALSLDRGAMAALWMQTGRDLATALALPFLLLVLAAAVGNLVQHKLVLSADPLKPKLSKISPLAGAKRLFSPEALVNFAKGVSKLGLVSILIMAALWPELERLETVLVSPAVAILPLFHDMAVRLLFVTLLLMTVIAGLDFMWQKHRFFERQKMTLKEVKDEHKDSDGDPAVKAKIRQLRMERGRARMMSRVPEATVIITNPTHYAVALSYDEGMNAPICVAKGVDAVALKIREVAESTNVPIVENPPLARALYATVEIDDQVPEDHYKAVAEVIGFVMRLKRN